MSKAQDVTFSLVLAALKSLLTLLENSPWVKAGGTFVAEAAGGIWPHLGKQIEQLPQDQREALSRATPVQLSEALNQIGLAAWNSAFAAAGIQRLEKNVDSLRELVHAYHDTLREHLSDLTRQLNEMQMRSMSLTARSSELAGAARVTTAVLGVSELNPHARAVVGELSKAIERFDREVPPDRRRGEDDLSLRVAWAALANAESRYTDAEALLTDTDERSLARPLVELLYTRAVTYCGLREWRRALDKTQHILAFDAEHLPAFDLRGLCLASLGRLREAVADFNKAISIRTRLVE